VQGFQELPEHLAAIQCTPGRNWNILPTQHFITYEGHHVRDDMKATAPTVRLTLDFDQTVHCILGHSFVIGRQPFVEYCMGIAATFFPAAGRGVKVPGIPSLFLPDDQGPVFMRRLKMHQVRGELGLAEQRYIPGSISHVCPNFLQLWVGQNHGGGESLMAAGFESIRVRCYPPVSARAWSQASPVLILDPAYKPAGETVDFVSIQEMFFCLSTTVLAGFSRPPESVMTDLERAEDIFVIEPWLLIQTYMYTSDCEWTMPAPTYICVLNEVPIPITYRAFQLPVDFRTIRVFQFVIREWRWEVPVRRKAEIVIDTFRRRCGSKIVDVCACHLQRGFDGTD
jgi:hypothetical protein